MVVHGRVDGDVAILSNFGWDDPRHFDAAREVRDLIARGIRKFVLELAGVRGLGPTGLGLLVTLTREVRRAGGQLVLARVTRPVLAEIEEMRMEDYWDIAESVEEAQALLPRSRA